MREEAAKWENAEFPDELFNVIYKLYGLRRLNPNSTKHPRSVSSCGSPSTSLSQTAAGQSWRNST